MNDASGCSICTRTAHYSVHFVPLLESLMSSSQFSNFHFLHTNSTSPSSTLQCPTCTNQLPPPPRNKSTSHSLPADTYNARSALDRVRLASREDQGEGRGGSGSGSGCYACE